MDAWEIISIIFGSLIGLFLFVGFPILIAKFGTPKAKAQRAETRVAAILQEYINEYGGYLINDVILPYGNRTTQIDHILFAKIGIFVIETKNWGGKIYGNDQNQYWTQIIGFENIKKHQHYNPVWQNRVHIKALRVHTKEYEKGRFYNVVVFAKNNIENIQSNCVIARSQLLNNLKKIKKQYYTSDKLKNIYEKIKYYIEHPPVSLEQHASMVKQNHPGL